MCVRNFMKIGGIMKNIKALVKFLPVLVMAVLMISGVDALMAAPAAAISAIIVAMITEKLSFQQCLDAAMGSISKIAIALFILMFAYAMASAFMATGVGASIVNVALKLGVTGKTVAVVGIVVTAILSVATGTSWGTFAACAPIFLWLNHIVGGDILLTTASIAGGACFGDSIGLISDTVVVSSGIQGVKVTDRIRHQGIWSIICLIIAVIIIAITGFTMNLPEEVTNGAVAIDAIPDEVWEFLSAERPAAVDLLNQVKEGVPVYMVIPLVIVISLAIMGLSTFICLGAGIVSAYVFGTIAGTVGSFGQYVLLIQDGFSEAGSWVIVMMMWIAAFGGIMGKIDAFKPLTVFVVRVSKKVRHLMTLNALLALFGNACFADEMAQIVTVGPVIRNNVEENVIASEDDMYKLKLRTATFCDGLGVFGSQLIPWHVYLSFYVSIASAVYPLHKFVAMDLIRYNFLAMIAVFSLILLTFTGFDRFIPRFRMPQEPEVKLKK